MSSAVIKPSLYNLYFASPDMIDALWDNTVRLTRQLAIPCAKSDVLKKATYPYLFSHGDNLFFPMLDEYGEIIKVCAHKQRGATAKGQPPREDDYKINTLMYWPGNSENKTLYIVQSLPLALTLKYTLTDNEGIIPDVLFINSFLHSVKNKEVFNKYDNIIAIGTAQIHTILARYGLTPTITLVFKKRETADPIYIVLRLLREFINEKNLSKSSDCRISIDDLKREYPSIFTSISCGTQIRKKRSVMWYLRYI